jgi:hypothetical protein
VNQSGSGEPEVYRITGAQRPHSSDLDQRMGRYLLSMGIRTACVVLVLVVHGPARWVFAVGAIVLPYVAVVMANSRGSRREGPVAPPSSGPSRSVTGGPSAEG